MARRTATPPEAQQPTWPPGDRRIMYRWTDADGNQWARTDDGCTWCLRTAEGLEYGQRVQHPALGPCMVRGLNLAYGPDGVGLGVEVSLEPERVPADMVTPRTRQPLEKWPWWPRIPLSEISRTLIQHA